MGARLSGRFEVCCVLAMATHLEHPQLGKRWPPPRKTNESRSREVVAALFLGGE